MKFLNNFTSSFVEALHNNSFTHSTVFAFTESESLEKYILNFCKKRFIPSLNSS